MSSFLLFLLAINITVCTKRIRTPRIQTVMLNTITPSKILLEGHKSELETYKGIMISKENAAKDKFKIDLLKMLEDK